MLSTMSKPRSPPRAPRSPPGRRCQQRTRPLAAPPRRCAGSPARRRRPRRSPRWRETCPPRARGRDPRAVSNLRFFADAATQFSSESHHGEAGLNHPAPAAGHGRHDLAVEPAAVPVHLEDRAGAGRGQHRGRETVGGHPHSATLLGEIAADIGFPAGVLNIVHGRGPEVGEAIVASRGEGDQLHRQHRGRPPHRRHRRADAEEAVAGTRRQEPHARLRRQRLAREPRRAGAFDLPERRRICLCGSRVLVEREIHAEVRDALVERALALRVGDPLDEDTRLGPLASAGAIRQGAGRDRARARD